MRHIRSVLWKFSRWLYVLSSIMLLVLLVLVLKDAGGVMWRSICLVLFIGAVLYEVMWRSDRKTCLEVITVMWFPAISLCTVTVLYGLVSGFVMWRWPADAVRYVVTGFPYALLAGGGLSVLFVLFLSLIAGSLRRN
ncbi:hypothetical protein [Salmonella enterica]|uniref:hypothetical protein n=1 Tax=Salmonella enterica TaxID=28901 RepID=UPI000A57BFFA|nr:hypothetical protein [Salmonella enterica]